MPSRSPCPADPAKPGGRIRGARGELFPPHAFPAFLPFLPLRVGAGRGEGGVFGEHVAEAAGGEAEGMAFVFEEADAARGDVFRDVQREHVAAAQRLFRGLFRHEADAEAVADEVDHEIRRFGFHGRFKVQAVLLADSRQKLERQRAAPVTDEWMTHHLFQRHGAILQIAERLRRHKHVPKLAQPRFLQRAEHPARNRRHRKVDGPGLEFLHRLKRRASVHTQLHSRVERVKTFQPRQHPAPQRRLARPYGYAPRLQTHRLSQLLAPPPELLAARFHMRVKDPPLGRELHPAPVAYEQTTPELTLQRRHRSRYRRLTREQHGRRTAEIPTARHLIKYAAKYLKIWFELVINGTKLL